MTFKKWTKELVTLLADSQGIMKLSDDRLRSAREYHENGLTPRDFFIDVLQAREGFSPIDNSFDMRYDI